MGPPAVPLRTFRVASQLLLLLSVAATVAGLYAALHGRWVLAALGIGAGILLLLPPQFLSIRPEAGSERTLLFVTKPDCALCDEARLLLPQLLADTTLRIDEAPLERDRFLRRHFRDAVPVLLWQGEELARLRWDPEALRRRLTEIDARVRGAASQGQNP